MFGKKALCKIIIIGDSGVGKTSLIRQFTDRRFTETYHATIGADFLTKEVCVKGRIVTLQLWDTAGQERFQSLGTAYYRGADCCILVYDLTRPSTLSSLEQWKDEFLIQASPRNAENFPFVIIGNKADLVEGDSTNAKLWFDNIQAVSHFKTSAKHGANVEAAFHEAAKKALAWEEEQETDDFGIISDIELSGTDYSTSCAC